MGSTAKRLAGPGQLTNSAVTQYTAPALTTAVMRSLHVFNATGGAVTFTMSIGADAAGTRLYDGVSIPALSSLDWSGFMVLAAAEILQAKASAGASLTLTISGVEITI